LTAGGGGGGALWRSGPSGALRVLALAGVLALGTACADAPRPEPLLTGPADPALPPARPLGWWDVAEDTVTFAAVLGAEDRRAPTGADLEILLSATTSPIPGIRRAAVRGLGRLERPELVERLLPALEDEDPLVRGEAANALAQSVHRAEGGAPEVTEAERALLARLGEAAAMEEPGVRGLLLRSLGRLPVADSRTVVERASALLEFSLGPADTLGVRGDAPGEELLGMTMGAHQLVRRSLAAEATVPASLIRRLEALARPVDGPPRPAAIRRMATLSRLAAAPPDRDLLEVLFQDEDAGVRRLAAAAVPILPEDAPRDRPIATALADPDAQVRIEAVRSWARALQDSLGCAPLRQATEDPSDAVALVALGALGSPCPADEQVPQLLSALAEGLPAEAGGGWHRAAGALMALVQVDPPRARTLLPAFVGHPSPFVRSWAARAAGPLENRDVLRTLAGDPVPNVRQAAVAALFPLEGRRADSILVAQLEFDDPQLLMTTANLLEGSRAGGPAVPALFRALGRLTESGASTTRDARVPLLRRIGELGTFWQAAQVDPYLTDIDPLVAQEAAQVLEAWTGERLAPTPRGLPTLPLPTPGELWELETLRVEMEMEEGGVVVLRLLPFEAPTNAARFAAMVREGTLDGLTLHRVVPNFVVQGGSPGANEYAGHGAYTRDEVGLLSHWKGTVGISTRGHDTGDGQIFVNLVDNPRLDHDYTIFAEVVEGMEVVEAMQEGARIREVRTVSPPEDGEGDRD